MGETIVKVRAEQTMHVCKDYTMVRVIDNPQASFIYEHSHYWDIRHHIVALEHFAIPFEEETLYAN